MVKGRIPLVAKLKNQTCNMFSITTFGELLKSLPRSDFERLVKRHDADKYCKRFRHWDHLVVMLFAQLSGASGLRTLEKTFNHHEQHHYHLGVKQIRRSTVSDANENRAETVFREVVDYLIGKVARCLRSDAKEFMYLLDSTSVTLKGREFDRWTKSNSTRNTQGLKLHVLLDARANVPAWHAMSPANVNDVTQAQTMPLAGNALYVFDKGYCDYNWWDKIDKAGSIFVTRFKKNCALNSIEQRPIPPDARDLVLADEIITFRHKKNSGRINHYDRPLRRIRVIREGKQTPLILATNDVTSSALEIAQRYKERWDIELFFKWIKQHLEIKQFFGRSENAVRIQILTALITYLLVAIYHQIHGAGKTMWETLSLVMASLFSPHNIGESYYRRRKRELEEAAERQMRLI